MGPCLPSVVVRKDAAVEPFNPPPLVLLALVMVAFSHSSAGNGAPN